MCLHREKCRISGVASSTWLQVIRLSVSAICCMKSQLRLCSFVTDLGTSLTTCLNVVQLSIQHNTKKTGHHIQKTRSFSLY